jgi:predicted nucleic acid-binding protein
VTSAILDATVVIAAVDSDDPDHGTGFDILQGVDHGDLPTGLIVSDALQEVLNFIAERKSHAVAVDVLDRLVRGENFELPYNPKQNYGAARSLFRSNERLNFGDALQVAFMQNRDIEYIYSFDDDFDSVDGIRRLNTSANPYEST